MITERCGETYFKSPHGTSDRMFCSILDGYLNGNNPPHAWYMHCSSDDHINQCFSPTTESSWWFRSSVLDYVTHFSYIWASQDFYSFSSGTQSFSPCFSIG
jgi:hypothetical protein